MIVNFFRALQAGHELSNAESWKRAQIRVGLLITFLTAVLSVAKAFGYEVNLSTEEISSIATVIGLIGGLLLSVGTAVSTKRVGLSTRTIPELPKGPDGTGGIHSREPVSSADSRPSGLDNDDKSNLPDMRYRG